MDTNNLFVGDPTPLTNLAGSELHGVRQSGLGFIKGATYYGRVVTDGDSTANIYEPPAR
jgi:hypothetical protein